MIEAKDLRIGNYVTIDNKESWPLVSGFPMQVISISQRADEDFPNSNASITMQRGIDLFSQFNEFVCPIVLTEEILIKAGFNETSAGYYSNGKIEIGYTTTDDWLEYEYISITGQTEMTALKYIHQLQNLFYNLTGEELTINL